MIYYHHLKNYRPPKWPVSLLAPERFPLVDEFSYVRQTTRFNLSFFASTSFIFVRNLFHNIWAYPPFYIPPRLIRITISQKYCITLFASLQLLLILIAICGDTYLSVISNRKQLPEKWGHRQCPIRLILLTLKTVKETWEWRFP